MKKYILDHAMNIINTNYPNWKNNKYVIKYILSNGKIISRFKELNII